jgi:hypothetical protein
MTAVPRRIAGQHGRSHELARVVRHAEHLADVEQQPPLVLLGAPVTIERERQARRQVGDVQPADGQRGPGQTAARDQSRRLASRAPSAIARSFSQAIVGWTWIAAAKVAKPQSVPAITFSRPTSSA